MRKVVLLGPRVGRKAVSRTIENWLPSIARWKVSADDPGADALSACRR